MTVDEVIAENINRIREERRVSVVQFAELMGVGRHIVYDWQRPRKGTAQRAFLWSEIVQLCAALGVTIFELVLPPDDGSSPNARDGLMETLFGSQFKPDDIDTLISMKARREEKLLGELKSIIEREPWMTKEVSE